MNLAARFAALSAALFLVLPCTAAAQEDPEAVYAKFHRAMATANYDELKKHSSAEVISEMEKMPADQRKGMLFMAAMLMPPAYTITGKQPSPDGNRFTIRATAKLPTVSGEKPEQANGEITLVKQAGAWKVHLQNWQNADPTAEARRAATGSSTTVKVTPPSEPQRLPVPSRSAAPKAPAPVVGRAKEPCVYKSVMTNEDMERCR